MSRKNIYQFPFARYPAVRIALVLASGIVTARQTGLDTLFPLYVVFLGLCFFLLIVEFAKPDNATPAKYRISVATFVIVIFLFGMLRYGIHRKQMSTPEISLQKLFKWQQINFKGTVYNLTPTASGQYHLDIAVDSTYIQDTLIWTHRYNLRGILDSSNTNGLSRPGPGTGIFFKATIRPLEEPRNPHAFDYRKYLASQNIFLHAGIDTVFSRRPPKRNLNWTSFRQRVLGLIDLNFPVENRDVAKALLLGYKNELDRNHKKAYSRVGLAHIMAVSGLHVGFIIAPFWMVIPFFWSFRYGKSTGLSILVVLLAGYAGLTGFSSSVSRAALTGGFITYGKLFHKAGNSINLTAVSAVILLLINPADLFTPGFQLSFSAVFIILLTLPTINSLVFDKIRGRWYGKVANLLVISAVVQVGLFPLLGYYFGEFSLVGPAANALVVPFAGVVVPFALALLPVTALWPAAGRLLNFPNERALSGLEQLVEWGSTVEWSWFAVQPSSAMLFLTWIAAILLLASLNIPELRWKIFCLLLVLLTLNLGIRLQERLKPGVLTVTFFDVGQGDAALVQTPGGRHYLIDTGRWSPGYNSAGHIILPHLEREGIGRLNGVFLSHPHADHIGGAAELLTRLPIDTLYNSGYRYKSSLYRNYHEIAQKRSVPVRNLKSGRRVRLEPGIDLLVYGPASVLDH
ncbi:MAG: DNA internalization-related competence protein ComEC/Rec2, partial [Balneolaceae bacterium]|nr:DNA internalization-related competence protein ComEC/Rec2 [Balneolaceae bacterium]